MTFRRLAGGARGALLLLLCSCHSPKWHRDKADETAYGIIGEKQKEAFGRTEPFTIERPADALRRRILEGQGLLHVGPDSLGTDALEPIPHWPKDADPPAPPPSPPWEGADPFLLSLEGALQVGARNSREYQTRKEAVFLAALDLDLERNSFRTIAAGSADVLAEANLESGADDGIEAGADASFTRLLRNGALLAGAIGIDLVKLLSGDSSALGVFGDLSISIPLLRGAGKHVVLEPLTQAERDVVYALREFERYRHTFAVAVASDYLEVLRLLDRVRNAEENYRGLIVLSRRTRALAAAGRLPGVQVDQARQDELRARDDWIAALQAQDGSLDSFKESLGLPPDARIELLRDELDRMEEIVGERFPKESAEGGGIETGEVPAADAAVELPPLDTVNRGWMELDEGDALGLAFGNRQDLLVARGRVYDAQRGVVVAADALRAGLTLAGAARFGETRGIGTADLENGTLDLTDGVYSAGLFLDLPFERTAERNAYRAAYIDLERAVRAVQALEDRIKIEVREALRGMLSARESVRIQVEAVQLARDRVQSTNLFLEAGRAQVRDVLEAQEALLGAQNSLTGAQVGYRVATLEMQRDLGVLEVDETGLWKEYGVDEVP